MFDLPAVIWIVIGVGLLLAAARPARPPFGRRGAKRPRWLRAIANAGLARQTGIGLFLATASVRNLALLAAAAGVIARAELGPLEWVVTIAGFVAVSSLGVLIPLLVRVSGGPAADAWLNRWSNWLRQHLGTITAVVMAVLGSYLAIRGIRGIRELV
jgi:hypothetical protein